MSQERTNISISDLNEKQYEIAKNIIDTPPSETKYHILRASRQSGKTFLLLRLALYFAFEKPNQKGSIISASFIQFDKLWKELIEITPPALILELKKYTSTIIFANGTSIQFFTAKNYNSIVGNSFDFLLGDEVALYPINALNFITPVLDAKKDSKAVFASTPRGKNDFYYYCMAGMDTHSTFVRHYKMSYLDNPNYDVRAVEEKRKTMAENIFKSEYLAEFMFGNSSVFGVFSDYQTVDDWKAPIAGEKYYGGIDVSGDGEDSTILYILNAKGETVFVYECESGNIPEQVKELTPIIKKYNNAFVKCECNGLGLGLAEYLQIENSNVTKFWMSNESKNDLVKRAKEALFNKTLTLPHIDLFPKLDNEMSSFVVSRTATGKLTYSHEKGFHDDTVDAMMIANYQREVLVFGTEVGTILEENTIQHIQYPTGLDIQNYNEGLYDDD